MVAVTAVPTSLGDYSRFDCRAFEPNVIAACGNGVEHIAIASPFGPLRLDVAGGSLLDGPVRLHVRLALSADLPFQLDTLSKLMRLTGITGGARWRAPPDRRLARLVEALRVGDALSDGGSLRDIACVMLGRERVQQEWPGAGDSMKSWVRRRATLARRLHASGPRAVLHRMI